MRSAAKLHYAQAQAAIDGQTDGNRAARYHALKPLYDAYAALRREREARGPLDLDLPERKILLKPDGTVDRVISPPRLDAHRLIEEFMILANVAAAETVERARMPLIYRVHDEPSLEKLEALRKFLETLHISLPKGGTIRPAQFNGILARVKNQDVEQLVNEVVLRSQAQAEYSAENYGHFGLNYAATPISPRRSAATPTSPCIARSSGPGSSATTEHRNTWTWQHSAKSRHRFPLPNAAP